MTSAVKTRAQLRSLGYSDAQVDNKIRRRVWTSRHRGVVVPSASHLTFVDRIAAAVAAVGSPAIVGRRTAADVWQLEGLPSLDEPDLQPIELWVPPDVNAESRPGINVRHTTVHHDEIVTVDGLRVTSPARTVVDLARKLPRVTAVVICDAGLRQNLYDVSELDPIIERLGRQRGVVAVRVMRGLTRPRTRSCWETRARLTVIAGGFPEPEVNYQILEDGIVLAEGDLVLEQLLIWIEYDGFDEHTKREIFRRDRPRQRFVERRGWQVLRMCDSDVRRPAGFWSDLRAAIEDAPRRIAAMPATRSPEVAIARRALGLD
jgi:hypothetical protein